LGEEQDSVKVMSPTVGLPISGLAQISGPRVSKASSSTERIREILTGPWEEENQLLSWGSFFFMASR
jgi:hypothetical protein